MISERTKMLGSLDAVHTHTHTHRYSYKKNWWTVWREKLFIQRGNHLLDHTPIFLQKNWWTVWRETYSLFNMGTFYTTK